MDAGKTCTGIRLHDPRGRLRAPIQPLRRQAAWIGLATSSCVLGSGECRRGKLHVTILTAFGIVRMLPPAMLDRLERSLKKAVSSAPFLVAGEPEPILDPITDLPHRAIVTLHIRSQLHTKLFSTRNAFLQSFGQCRSDIRTSFHLSVDNAELSRPPRA